MKVYKYELELDRYTDLLLPIEAKVVMVGVQHRRPCMWMKLPLEPYDEVRRRFAVIMTGEEYEGNLEHVGSFQMNIGSDNYFVGHVFEVLPDLFGTTADE